MIALIMPLWKEGLYQVKKKKARWEAGGEP